MTREAHFNQILQETLDNDPQRFVRVVLRDGSVIEGKVQPRLSTGWVIRTYQPIQLGEHKQKAEIEVHFHASSLVCVHLLTLVGSPDQEVPKEAVPGGARIPGETGSIIAPSVN